MLEEIPAGYNLYVPLQFHCSDFIGCNKGGANGLEPLQTSEDLFDKHVNTLENLSWFNDVFKRFSFWHNKIYHDNRFDTLGSRINDKLMFSITASCKCMTERRIKVSS